MKKIKNLSRRMKLVLLIAIIGIGSVSGYLIYTNFFTSRRPAYDIWLPRLSVPVIIEVGGSFNVTVDSLTPVEESSWEITISSEFLSKPLSVDNVIQDGTRYILNVSVPPDLTPDLYNITVSDGTHTDSEPNAVSVVSEIKDTFSFIHLTDIHLLAEDEWYEDYYDFNQYTIPKIIQEINLINPDFVLLTGDITNDGLTKQYEHLTRLLVELEVPIYIVAGNHAFFNPDALLEYERWYGPIYYSFDYGDYHFVMLQSGGNPPNTVIEGISDEQIQWFEEDLASNENAEMIFVGLHHPAFEGEFERNNEVFKQLCEDYNVNMVFAGHRHKSRVYNSDGQEITNQVFFPGTIYVETTTGGKQANTEGYALGVAMTGYRLIRVSADTIISYTYDYNHDGNRDPVLCLPFDNISHSYTLNDGSQTTVNATIVNLLWEYFEQAQLTFQVHSDSIIQTHGVINGVPKYVIQQGSTGSVFVKTFIPKNNQSTVSIVPGHYFIQEGSNANESYLMDPTNNTVLYNRTECSIISHSTSTSSDIIQIMSNGTYQIASAKFDLPTGKTISRITLTSRLQDPTTINSDHYTYESGTGILTIQQLTIIPSSADSVSELVVEYS